MRYRLLSLLEQDPAMSQRELAERAGISLGKVNYCLKGLADQGWIKMHNFRSSRTKRAYLYKLTPAGIAEKVRVTKRFLRQRLDEHASITAEIERLRLEIRDRSDHQ